MKKLIAILILSVVSIISFNIDPNNVNAETKDVEVKKRTIDLNQQESNIEKSTDLMNEKHEFIGDKYVVTGDYLLEDDNLEEALEQKYKFTYDQVTSILTIEMSILIKEEWIIDELEGVVFKNDKGEVDVYFNIEGNEFYLSDINTSSLIDNVGWFSNITGAIGNAVGSAANAVKDVAVTVAKKVVDVADSVLGIVLKSTGDVIKVMVLGGVLVLIDKAIDAAVSLANYQRNIKYSY